MLTTSVAAGQVRTSALKPGDELPHLAGQSLSGKQLDLNTATSTGRTVLIFSFSRAGGRDAQNWSERISKDFPQLTVYTLIFLESVPRIFRSMAISGIKEEMPRSMSDRTVIFYTDESAWKQRLQFNAEGNASVILLEPGSHISWITRGPFAEVSFQELSRRAR